MVRTAKSKIGKKEKNDRLYKAILMLETEEAARTLCITVNPVSAYGWKFDKDDFLHRMREAVDVPVINVKEELA